MKLQTVMDTNVLISSILWRGVPFQLLKWAEEGRLRIYISLEIFRRSPWCSALPKISTTHRQLAGFAGGAFCEDCIVVHSRSGRSGREGRMF